tara:strand:- start:851 stop:2227 length:1377 start_codon:yes stop_codon:yes gene_type:complete
MPSTNYSTQQTSAFSVATDVSKDIGIPVWVAMGEMDKALPELRKGTREIQDAHAQLVEAIESLGEMSGAIGAAYVASQVTNTFDRINDLTRGFLLSLEYTRAAKKVLGEYKKDVESILESGEEIRRRVGQRKFAYQTGTGPQKHTVDSCRDLRSFDHQLTGMTGHIRRITQEIDSVRKTLDFYGSNAGKRRRKKTKELMTNTKHVINYTISALTSVMRSSWISILRKYIDKANGDTCGGSGGKIYIGPTHPYRPRAEARERLDPNNYRDATAQDYASRCHGLNQLSGLMRRMADVEGLTWTQYRQRWNRWSKDKKERQILLALKRVRKQLENLRDRDIPNARAEFVDAFRGMSKAVGRSGPGVGLSKSDIKEFGPIPKALLHVNAARGQGIRLGMQAAQTEPLMTAFSNPANVSCQSTSNYAGIFGGDDGEPMNPMLIVGGGFVAGLAVAHFFPNLLR